MHEHLQIFAVSSTPKLEKATEIQAWSQARHAFLGRKWNVGIVPGIYRRNVQYIPR